MGRMLLINMQILGPFPWRFWFSNSEGGPGIITFHRCPGWIYCQVYWGETDQQHSLKWDCWAQGTKSSFHSSPERLVHLALHPTYWFCVFSTQRHVSNQYHLGLLALHYQVLLYVLEREHDVFMFYFLPSSQLQIHLASTVFICFLLSQLCFSVVIFPFES